MHATLRLNKDYFREYPERVLLKFCISIARIQRILAKISTRILACLTLSFYEKQTMTT